MRHALESNWVVWESYLEPRPCGGGTLLREMDGVSEHWSLYAVVLNAHLSLEAILDREASGYERDSVYADVKHGEKLNGLDAIDDVAHGSDCDEVLWGE